ncbi:hypothetical protein OSB04_013838 [Centaurea solstitialis]|uniref:RRM domain-containing protein n=1 Tax=Centaurea solstitialis TaxID=347529 RepID=A0AA38TFS7_9ASTR|nr:hypothetical protein OSB04_013838 [Centaurea solstitialis]
MANAADVDALDFEPDDDDLMDEDAAVDVDASSPRTSTPIPKLKSAITGGAAPVTAPSSAPKKTKGRGFREETDAERNNRMSGRFDSLDSDGGPGPERWGNGEYGVYAERLQLKGGLFWLLEYMKKPKRMTCKCVWGGYALIEYESFEEAEKAIAAMDGGELLTQTVNVDWAFSKGPFRRRNNRRRSPRGHRSRSPRRRF